jgi:prepilin-type N-terminal cleavage/methylation domain-containing protein
VEEGEPVTARRHHHGPEAGVTLIEALVVVSIVGILLAAAVPSLVGSRSRQQDATAQHSLRAALTAADVAFTTNQSFLDAGVVALQRADTSLRYTVGDEVSMGPTAISLVNDTDLWAAAAQSETGTCYFIAARGDGRVRYGTATDGRCDGSTARTIARRDSW